MAALASLAAAIPLALLVRRQPDIALSCALAFGVAAGVPSLSRRHGLPMSGALEIAWLLPFVATWGAGEGFGLFQRVAWWDSVAHVLGGAMVAALWLAWLAPRMRLPWAATLVVGAALVVGVGGLWELGEYASDRLLRTATQRGLGDTMRDLGFDLAGGLVLMVWHALHTKAARAAAPAGP